MSDELGSLSRLFLDTRDSTGERLSAGSQMLEIDPIGSREILIEGASDFDADPRFLEGVGTLLARCAVLTTPLSEWDFRDMTEVAHDAYWEALP